MSDRKVVPATEPVATVVSKFGSDMRVGWLRPEQCEVGALLYVGATVVDMILHCPACGLQHIDAPENHDVLFEGVVVDEVELWGNPPHRSHLCHGCGHIWRPADVPTNGVAAIATKGSADSPAAAPVSGIPDLLKRLADNLEILDARPRPMCRDCADEDGTCPTTGLACSVRALIAEARASLPTPAECTNSDAWNCKYCRKTESCAVLQDARNFGQPSAAPAQPAAQGAVPVGMPDMSDDMLAPDEMRRHVRARLQERCPICHGTGKAFGKACECGGAKC